MDGPAPHQPLFPTELHSPYVDLRRVTSEALGAIRDMLRSNELLTEIRTDNDALVQMANRACNYATALDLLWQRYDHEQRALRLHSSKGATLSNETRVPGALAFAFLAPTKPPQLHATSSVTTTMDPPSSEQQVPTTTTEDSLEDIVEWTTTGESMQPRREPSRELSFDALYAKLRDWGDQLLERNRAAVSSAGIIGRTGQGNRVAMELHRRSVRLMGVAKAIALARDSQRRAFNALVTPRTLASERAVRDPASGFIALP